MRSRTSTHSPTNIVLNCTHTGIIQWNNKQKILKLVFSHASMFVHTALAAMDHNENTEREQRKTAGGQPMYALTKQRHGKKYYVKAIKVAKVFNWRNIMASLTVQVDPFIRTSVRHSAFHLISVFENWNKACRCRNSTWRGSSQAQAANRETL